MIILEEHFKWHLEAFASELFKYIYICHFVWRTFLFFICQIFLNLCHVVHHV